jgi:hypothetical protein
LCTIETTAGAVGCAPAATVGSPSGVHSTHPAVIILANRVGQADAARLAVCRLLDERP